MGNDENYHHEYLVPFLPKLSRWRAECLSRSKYAIVFPNVVENCLDNPSYSIYFLLFLLLPGRGVSRAYVPQLPLVG